MGERLLTAAEVADWLGFSAATVVDWTERDELPVDLDLGDGFTTSARSVGRLVGHGWATDKGADHESPAKPGYADERT